MTSKKFNLHNEYKAQARAESAALKNEFKERAKNISKAENLVFIYNNMNKEEFSLNDMPKEVCDSLLFMGEYFKVKREKETYSLIGENVLNDPIFLSIAIKKNPDIYFYMSEENKNEFKMSIVNSEQEFLKYLSKEDYLNPKIKNKIIDGFEYFNESLVFITPEILNDLMSSGGTIGDRMSIKFFNLDREQCKNMRSAISNYLETGKKISDDWAQNNININSNLYYALDKELNKSEKDKLFYTCLVGRYKKLFQELPEEWRNDVNVALEVIRAKSGESLDLMTTNVGGAYLVLNGMESPDELLGMIESMGDDGMDILVNVGANYRELKKRLRGKKAIIQNLFKVKAIYEISEDYLKYIPNVTLRDRLIAVFKRNTSFDRESLNMVSEALDKEVAFYYMEKHLESREVADRPAPRRTKI